MVLHQWVAMQRQRQLPVNPVCQRNYSWYAPRTMLLLSAALFFFLTRFKGLGFRKISERADVTMASICHLRVDATSGARYDQTQVCIPSFQPRRSCNFWAWRIPVQGFRIFNRLAPGTISGRRLRCPWVHGDSATWGHSMRQKERPTGGGVKC
ncbi:hypothetical protein BO78DRAFT_120209 [Aspergillus sclerotiicarbonarius CBS 121057]|uniref:Uncharacterized protein n=1 Tax=Aspergillus sclerotiicarbonarius (strain CBS 121057 / IBT 28362) TaxID=1448318 RepID=A0A319FGV4_ASPSB|nr:hypothetical protein BO78DRAFT_120209 [Aspergillus sclerotiicarbonarius CBS 121057]